MVTCYWTTTTCWWPTAARLSQSPIRSVLPDAIRQQARSPQGVVTNLFNTALRGEQTIAVGIPVTLQGQVQYSLFAEIRPQRISQILRRQALPAGWVAAALDKEALIVGRTREEARYIGQHAVPTLADAVRRQQDGTLHSTTKEGVPVLTAFSHSRDRMWAVAIGAPIASLQADLWRSMIWVLAVSLAIIAMGIWAAYRLALRIRTSITALIEPAIALGRGDTLPVPPTRYRETALLGSALRHAGQMLSDTQRLAYHDPLTSLCNRVLFTELASHALAAAARTSRSVAILAIDLDRFKIVNDTYGHGTGDRVLKIAAERMSGALRSSDVLSRFGGDEFVVLLDAGGQEAAEQVARNLNAALAALPRRARGPERIHRHRGLSGRWRHLEPAAAGSGQGAVPGQGRRPQPLRDRHALASGSGVGRRRYGRVTPRRRAGGAAKSPPQVPMAHLIRRAAGLMLSGPCGPLQSALRSPPPSR